MKPKAKEHLLFFTCLLLYVVSMLLCVVQFRISNLFPLVAACLLMGLVVWLKPKFRAFCIALPILAFSFLCLDAFVLHHRVAIEFRTWSLIWDTSDVEDVLPSPSGRSQVYIVGSHWLDSGYSAYVSGGGLFPQVAYIPTTLADASYGRDLTASWTGNTFIVEEHGVVLRYSEDARRLETFLK